MEDILYAIVRFPLFRGECRHKRGGNGIGKRKEKSLAAFLSEMDGVGTAEVRICEDENGVMSVAVVCDGAKNILVNSNIREAVSAALGVDEKNVKIYPKSR